MSIRSRFPALEVLQPIGESSLGPGFQLVVVLQPPFTAVSEAAVTVAESTGFDYINVGNLIQTHIERGTPAGKIFKDRLKSGAPISVDIALLTLYLAVAEQRTFRRRGFIIQGVPRSFIEAAALDELMPIHSVIDLDAEDEQFRLRGCDVQACMNLQCRATSRWSFSPRVSACAICGHKLAPLLQRRDASFDEELRQSRAVRGQLDRHYGPRFHNVMTTNEMTTGEVVATLQALLNPEAPSDATDGGSQIIDPTGDSPAEG